jgi:hypothetical protein
MKSYDKGKIILEKTNMTNFKINFLIFQPKKLSCNNKNYYLDEKRNKCFECNKNCLRGCTGEGENNCNKVYADLKNAE